MRQDCNKRMIDHTWYHCTILNPVLDTLWKPVQYCKLLSSKWLPKKSDNWFYQNFNLQDAIILRTISGAGPLSIE